MVVPLLALAGAGMQMYGSDQANAASDFANRKMQIGQDIIGGAQQQDQALTNSVLAGLGGQWNDSNATAVDALSAQGQRGAFNGAAGALGQDIAGAQGQPGVIDPMIQADADNIAFTRELATRKAGNQIRTDALGKVLENNAGLDAKNRLYKNTMVDKGDRDMMLRNRINDVLRLQNYANGIREAALAKTGAQHALDSASAASTGSGAMYLGALMQAGAVLQNRPQIPGQQGAGGGTQGQAMPGVGGPSSTGQPWGVQAPPMQPYRPQQPILPPTNPQV